VTSNGFEAYSFIVNSSYETRAPAPALRPFISHYAGFCAHGLTPGTHAGLPSRHAHLIISLGDPIEVLRMPARALRGESFTALVSGLHDAPATVRRGSSFEGLHVFLEPLGVHAIFGIPASELASRAIDLSDLWGHAAADLVDQLREASTWQARFAFLDEAFMRTLNPVGRPTPLSWAWRQLAVNHGSGSVEQLARDIGWSRQHLTERFRSELGITPKTAARIFRFERACRLMKEAQAPLSAIAASCGYSDQAHMTRDWNALAGCSPRAWIASELPSLPDYELAGGTATETP
jgi:AraC-like DNA-binding protein